MRECLTIPPRPMSLKAPSKRPFQYAIFKVMKRAFSLLLLVALLFPPAVNASLVTIDKGGEIILKVLSSQDELALGTPERNPFEVKEVATTSISPEDTSILLSKNDDGIYLNISGDEERKLEVTNWEEDLIEIEERGDVKRLAIALSDGKFTVTQAGVTAFTDLPISINAKENELSLETETGSTYLAISPPEAVESALRSKYISTVLKEGISIGEQTGVVAYAVSGQKNINLFNGK